MIVDAEERGLISDDDGDINNIAQDVRRELDVEDDTVNDDNVLVVGRQGSSSHLLSPAPPTPSRKRAGPSSTKVPPPKKSASGTGQNWAILEHIWPAFERPVALQDPEWIEQQTIGDLMQLHKVYQKIW